MPPLHQKSTPLATEGIRPPRKRCAKMKNITSPHLKERNHDEPRAALGVVHEDGLKPDPEPVALPAGLAVLHLNRLPLPPVRPGEQAVVLRPAALEPGQEPAWDMSQVRQGVTNQGFRKQFLAPSLSYKDTATSEDTFGKRGQRMSLSKHGEVLARPATPPPPPTLFIEASRMEAESNH